MSIFILGYGSLIWDLDDLAPKVRGPWRMGGGPMLPLEFSRISPKRKLSLVVVIDPAGDPCPTHAIASTRTRVAEAVADLAARERTGTDRIGWVDMQAGTDASHHPSVTKAAREWCAREGATGAVWTDLDANFEGVTCAPFSLMRGIDYLKTLEGESLAAALEYIDGAPEATDTPLRRALNADPWWRGLRTG
jgi:hypothetical protein